MSEKRKTFSRRVLLREECEVFSYRILGSYYFVHCQCNVFCSYVIMSVFIVERNLNKGGLKMTGKNRKGGFFNTFPGALKTVFDVLHRK